VLFTLYVAGIASAMAVAYALKRTALRSTYHPLLLEFARVSLAGPAQPDARSVERLKIFLQRVGTIIPRADDRAVVPVELPGATGRGDGSAIQYSFAGSIGRALEHVFAPIGFNWQISLALVPGSGGA